MGQRDVTLSCAHGPAAKRPREQLMRGSALRREALPLPQAKARGRVHPSRPNQRTANGQPKQGIADVA